MDGRDGGIDLYGYSAYKEWSGGKITPMTQKAFNKRLCKFKFSHFLAVGIHTYPRSTTSLQVSHNVDKPQTIYYVLPPISFSGIRHIVTILAPNYSGQLRTKHVMHVQCTFTMFETQLDKRFYLYL